MIDTNSIIQIGNNVQALLDATRNAQHALSPWLPALAVAAAWLGRELNRLASWSQNAAEKIIAHGGLIKILIKIFWNNSSQSK